MKHKVIIRKSVDTIYEPKAHNKMKLLICLSLICMKGNEVNNVVYQSNTLLCVFHRKLQVTKCIANIRNKFSSGTDKSKILKVLLGFLSLLHFMMWMVVRFNTRIDSREVIGSYRNLYVYSLHKCINWNEYTVRYTADKYVLIAMDYTARSTGYYVKNTAICVLWSKKYSFWCNLRF